MDGLQSVVEVRGGGHSGAGGTQPGQIVLTQQQVQQLQLHHVDPSAFTFTLHAPHTVCNFFSAYPFFFIDVLRAS